MIAKMLLSFSAVLFTAAVLSGGQSAWISGKAVVAQWLLNSAWQRSIETHEPNKAWPWADTAPVARMNIPSLDESFIVLSNASGEALAFGPGLVAGNPDKMNEQALAIGGHRDTHLSILETIEPGTRIWLQNTQGDSQQYRLTKQQVIDSRTETVALNKAHPGLVLITCYPFNAAATGGPLRLVLTAEAVPYTSAPTQTLNAHKQTSGLGQLSTFDPSI